MLAPDPEAYRAARESVALAPLSPGLLAFSGPDSRRFLQGLLTNDVASLAAGGAQKSCVLTPKGKLVGDFRLYDRGADLLAVLRSAAAQPVRDALAKPMILSDAKMEDLSGKLRAWLLIGPSAEALLARVFGSGPGPGCREAGLGAERAWLLSYPEHGPTGALVLSGAEAAGAALESAGRELGLRRADEAVLETLRIEARVPAFGIDFDADALPLEAGLEGAVSFSKGCYMGQETTARVKNFGHVNRRLVALSLSAPAEPGSALLVDGAEVGRLTSAVRSPREGLLALGMVRAGAAEAGTELQAAGGAQARVLGSL